MNVASADSIAQRVFLEQLRDNPVALRSRMDRDDIEDIEIVPMADLDVAATRQVIRLGAAADRTGEIDASDVLESIDVVDVLLPKTPKSWEHIELPPVTSAFVPPAPYGTAIDYEDDAYYAGVEHVSTNAVTFNLSEELEPEHALEPALERRSLGWIVATVLAAAAALVIGAVVAEHFPASVDASTRASAVAPPAPSPSVPAHATAATTPNAASATSSMGSMSVNALPSAAVPTVDVKSLPPAKVGAIVGTTRHPFFVDGTRATATTAVVACGKHQVRIGTSRKTHLVDVPCGGQIAVR